MKTLANNEWQQSTESQDQPHEKQHHGVNGKSTNSKLVNGKLSKQPKVDELEPHIQATPTPSMLDKFSAIPMVYKIGFMVLLLFYALVINIELSTGSQRYTLVVQGQKVESFSCLGKDEAIALQMRYEQRLAPQQQSVVVVRDKMHIFSKWIECGVF